MDEIISSKWRTLLNRFWSIEAGVGSLKMVLGNRLSKGHPMFPLSGIQFLKFAAVGSLVVLSAIANPARADEFVQNLGPVGPHMPILTAVGNKRVIAFFVPEIGHCGLNAVVWDSKFPDTGDPNTGTSAARVRISLEPGQILHIDSDETTSLNLRCADHAATLGIVDDDELVRSEVTVQQPAQQPVRASVSGY
jgi:hypothetical protein